MDSSDRRLYVNKRHRKFLGVCAGVADYLGTEAWLIRLAFVLGLVFGSWLIAPLSMFVWFLVPLYFGLWICLDTEPEGSRESLAGAKHSNAAGRRRPLYRSKKRGKLLGVCAGVAAYLGISTFVVRLLTVIGFFMSGALVGVAYIGVYFILDDEPERRGWRNVGRQPVSPDAPRGSSGRTARVDIDQCEHKLRTLQGRLARMEAYTTSRHYKLNQQFKDIS